MSQIIVIPNRLKAYLLLTPTSLSLSLSLHTHNLYPVVFLDAQFVHIIIAVQNSKSKPSRLVSVLLSHDLYVLHLSKLLDHVQDVLFCSIWGESTEKHLFCSLVGLRVLFLTRDSTLALHLKSDEREIRCKQRYFSI